MIYGIYSVRGWGIPDSKVRGTNMEPTWVLSAPDGPHIGPMNLAIKDGIPWRPYCRNNRECHPGHHYYHGAQPLSQINANHFQEQRALVMLVDCMYGCLILKRVAEAWLTTGCQDNSPAMSTGRRDGFGLGIDIVVYWRCICARNDTMVNDWIMLCHMYWQCFYWMIVLSVWRSNSKAAHYEHELLVILKKNQSEK